MTASLDGTSGDHVVSGKSVQRESRRTQVIFCQPSLLVSVLIEDVSNTNIVYQHLMDEAVGHFYFDD